MEGYAIQQFVDATHRELIDTSVIDKCKNQESEFEQLIKARYILESPKTNGRAQMHISNSQAIINSFRRTHAPFYYTQM